MFVLMKFGSTSRQLWMQNELHSLNHCTNVLLHRHLMFFACSTSHIYINIYTLSLGRWADVRNVRTYTYKQMHANRIRFVWSIDLQCISRPILVDRSRKWTTHDMKCCPFLLRHFHISCIYDVDNFKHDLYWDRVGV